ncbi:hypothetical protein JOB18_013321 [Solea senegalensis]|uniref:Uncharacterized protein n=1 Tax=Solea senegalensis TaxID=28829 RepID=A0AAV6QLS8_SOLSE|nr:hypothetical protein JOB18_013321 [Solea senegalensis]
MSVCFVLQDISGKKQLCGCTKERRKEWCCLRCDLLSHAFSLYTSSRARRRPFSSRSRDSVPSACAFSAAVTRCPPRRSKVNSLQQPPVKVNYVRNSCCSSQETPVVTSCGARDQKRGCCVEIVMSLNATN